MLAVPSMRHVFQRPLSERFIIALFCSITTLKPSAAAADH